MSQQSDGSNASSGPDIYSDLPLLPMSSNVESPLLPFHREQSSSSSHRQLSSSSSSIQPFPELDFEPLDEDNFSLERFILGDPPPPQPTRRTPRIPSGQDGGFLDFVFPIPNSGEDDSESEQTEVTQDNDEHEAQRDFFREHIERYLNSSPPSAYAQDEESTLQSIARAFVDRKLSVSTRDMFGQFPRLVRAIVELLPNDQYFFLDKEPGSDSEVAGDALQIILDDLKAYYERLQSRKPEFVAALAFVKQAFRKLEKPKHLADGMTACRYYLHSGPFIHTSEVDGLQAANEYWAEKLYNRFWSSPWPHDNVHYRLYQDIEVSFAQCSTVFRYMSGVRRQIDELINDAMIRGQAMPGLGLEQLQWQEWMRDIAERTVALSTSTRRREHTV